MSKYILSLRGGRLPKSAGSKALNLQRLSLKKINIPVTYVCTWHAYLDYHGDKPGVSEKLSRELQKIIKPDRAYAVRSSADVEDSQQHSFAGQFSSILDVKGPAAVLQALQDVWQATHTELVKSYQAHSQASPNEMRMAVIIQEMVTPHISGVAFSRNPVTGRDEIVIEAVRGDGAQLLQAGVTPFRWVLRWGAYIEQPQEEILPKAVLDHIFAQTNRIARMFKRQVDLEWIYDGQAVYWVQLRDITALHTGDIYSNRISREMTPGLIKPLVWSISIPIHSRQWVRILDELVGKTHINPDQMVRAFHYRAYYNMGVFGDIFSQLGMPRDSLEIMMGMVPKGGKRPKFMPGIGFARRMPQVIRFLVKLLRFGPEAERIYLLLNQQVHSIDLDVSSTMSPKALLRRVDLIVELQERISYHTIISIILMQLYNAIFRSRLKARQVDPEQFNLTDGWEQLQTYDPNFQLARLNVKMREMDEELQQDLRRGDIRVLEQRPELETFRQLFDEFLHDYGHISDSTVDFTSVPWRENPGLILRLICEYTPPAASQAKKVCLEDLRSSVPGFKILEFLYQRAREFRLHRESYSALYTYTLMVLRVTLRALGGHLVERGFLGRWEDIFYLNKRELHAWAEGQSDGAGFVELVTRRKEEMLQCQYATLPELIYGDQIPPVRSSGARKLCGVPTSGGYYCGPVKVIRGLSDFSKLQPGDVLVIPFSDVGWTPLFTRAGGVIAESGGILSHSSIVAREFGIPAVVSVPGAMELMDGTLVELDGYQGDIYIQDQPAGRATEGF